MTKILSVQTNFTAGEISPRFYGHTDLVKYKNAVKTATNSLVLPHGPIVKRAGLEYIDTGHVTTNKIRLLRFQFSATDSYILEFGHNYISFFKNGARILSGGSPYIITTTYTGDELAALTFLQFGRFIVLTHGSHYPAKLTWTSDASWALADGQFYPPPTIEDGWLADGVIVPGAVTGAGITFSSTGPNFLAADVGRQIINLSGAGRAIITAVTDTTHVVCTITEDFPSTTAIPMFSWKMDLSPIASVTPSGSRVGSLITLTALAASWQATMIGSRASYVLINGGVTKIYSLTSSTVANVEVQKTLTSLAATTTWSIEENVWTATRGYPKTCSLHQQRLLFGGTSTEVQTIWGSETGLLTSMGVGSEDSDSIVFDLSTKDISSISWISSLRGDLIIGTASAEVTINASNGGAIVPTNIVQQVRGYSGSNLQQPVTLDDQILYIQKSSKKLNAMRYDFQLDNYISEDLLFYAEHMPLSGIKEIAYAADPDRHIYAVLNNGECLVCTYMREQQVQAWTRLVTNGLFEGVQTISTGVVDEVWFVINRTINGTATRYIERLAIADGSSNIDIFSDSCLTYSLPKTITSITKASPAVVTATAHGFNNGDRVKIIGGEMIEAISKTYLVSNKTTNTFELTDLSGANIDSTSYTSYISGGNVHKLVLTITGLSHLEGKTVQVKTDGATHPAKVVSSGAIILDRYSYEVTVGLPYSMSVETLPMEYNLGSGSQQYQQTRHVRPVIRTYKSSIPMLNGEFLPARSPSDKMDSAVGLFTGDLIYGDLTWGTSFASSILIEDSNPLPIVILSIGGSVEGGVQ